MHVNCQKALANRSVQCPRLEGPLLALAKPWLILTGALAGNFSAQSSPVQKLGRGECKTCCNVAAAVQQRDGDYFDLPKEKFQAMTVGQRLDHFAKRIVKHGRLGGASLLLVC